MLKMASRQGIHGMIATPHFYAHHDTPAHFLQQRRESLLRLQEAMSQEEDLPAIRVGAEVYYFSGISDSDILDSLVIEGTNCVLLEMPMDKWTKKMYKELEDIRLKRGLLPIIAHVDRYLSPLRTHGIPQALEKLPVAVQANANFFIRHSTRQMALRMLRSGQIHLLGSDCHNSTSRPPNLESALEIISHRLDVSVLDNIVAYQQDILNF